MVPARAREMDGHGGGGHTLAPGGAGQHSALDSSSSEGRAADGGGCGADQGGSRDVVRGNEGKESTLD